MRRAIGQVARTPEGDSPISGDAKGGYYVASAIAGYDIRYPLASDRPLESIDAALGELLTRAGKNHPDVDRLLEARHAITLETTFTGGPL